MKGVQCYELFGGIALKNHAFSFSLSLSTFAVAQALTPHMHDCIELSSSDIRPGGADICNCKSSANEWRMIVCELTLADKGYVHMVKRIWPRAEPWGTPECTGTRAEQ